MEKKSTYLKLRIHRQSPEVEVPRYSHSGDAGLDLVAAESVTLAPGAWKDVKTGFSMGIPDGFVGLVVPRSGLALKSGVTVLNAPGVIDAGYRGEVRVILLNLGGEAVKLNRGARIAQLLILEIPTVEIEEVTSFSSTERGDRGFGSSGE